jgi:PAS domain S-box-containing protein
VLREHEALLQAMFDTLPQMVFVEDRERRYLMVNRNFADAMGMSPAMMVGKHADEIAAAPEHEAIRAADADRAILSGAEAATTLVQEMVFADGVPRVVRSMRRPLRDGSGQVTGLVGIIEDITALQAAEQQANLAHARLADAIQHLWGGIYLFDREERLVMWNEKVHDLFPSLRGRLRPGMTFEEILRIAGPDVELPDLAPEAQLQARLEEFRNPPEHLIEHRLQDGRWVLVRDRHTSEGGTVCLRLDVTEQKQAQEALRESEQRFRMLTENAPDMLFRYRIWPERGFEYVSPISTAIIGYSPQEHYADPDLWVRIADPDSRAQQERMFDPESDIVGALVSVRWKYKGAGWIWIEVRATPVLDEQGRQVALEGIVRDISARKELEGQLLQSQRMEAVGRLAGGIAHDFNNMLTIMSNYATFALEAQPEGSPASDDIRVILKTIQRSTALTRQLLAFSRKQILQMKLVQLNDLIRETGSILERVIGEDIELALNLAEDLWLVNADTSQVEQIVMNLAVNARDAMPKGGALILETSNVEFAAGAALGAAAELAGPYVMLAVTDTGTGMPPAVRERIFEPFYTTKPTGQGTGLGLSTVHGIVKQMHGEIWVYSEEGIGTTFKIYLPRAEAAGPPRPAPDVLRAPKRGTETILLVEDEELVRLAVQRVLQGAGYRVIAAANPLAAESIVTQAAEPIHLLLTDVVMPETSGPELVQRLLKRQPSLRVLYMTGYTETALASHFPSRGALASVVQKPFSRSSLLQAVRGVLDAAAG